MTLILILVVVIFNLKATINYFYQNRIPSEKSFNNVLKLLKTFCEKLHVLEL